MTLDLGAWGGEQISWGEHASIAYTRPYKPPVGAFQPDRISEYLHDLHGLFTAASRVGRGGLAGLAGAQRNGRKGLPKPTDRVRPAERTSP